MERARQAQTKRVVSSTDETREEGITPLLSVSFFLARPSTRPWGVFVQCAELCLSKKEVNFRTIRYFYPAIQRRAFRQAPKIKLLSV